MNALREALMKVSLVEPVARDVEMIRGLVTKGGIPAVITDAIASEHPEDIADAEVILLGLEELGRVEIAALTKLHAGFPGIPLIVLAGPGVATRTGEAIGLGAQHVLLKSELTPDKLSSALRYFLDYAPGQATHTA